LGGGASDRGVPGVVGVLGVPGVGGRGVDGADTNSISEGDSIPCLLFEKDVVVNGGR
jgi:hypothetical protein